MAVDFEGAINIVKTPALMGAAAPHAEDIRNAHKGLWRRCASCENHITDRQTSFWLANSDSSGSTVVTPLGEIFFQLRGWRPAASDALCSNCAKSQERFVMAFADLMCIIPGWCSYLIRHAVFIHSLAPLVQSYKLASWRSLLALCFMRCFQLQQKC